MKYSEENKVKFCKQDNTIYTHLNIFHFELVMGTHLCTISKETKIETVKYIIQNSV